MICKKCGAQLADDARYCLACGKPVDEGTKENTQSKRFCKKCGEEIEKGVNYCIACGAPAPTDVQNSEEGHVSAGWGVLGFFIPLVGLILYIVWKQEKPRQAKMVGTWALIGVIVAIVLRIILIAIAKYA